MALLMENNYILPFFFLTVLFGGWAARITGRSLASVWNPAYFVLVSVIPLAAAIRFLHFALFGNPLVSAPYFLMDYATALGFAAWGYYSRRAELMSRLYPWLFERTGPLTWRRRRI